MPDDGSPGTVEQPVTIRTPPLNPTDQDDRVRAVFALTGDDPLPEVDDEMLQMYHRYLKGHLKMPFEGIYSREIGFIRSKGEIITVVALADAEEIDDMYGLFCQARQGRHPLVVPLGEVEVKEGDPNRELVADYSYWFWNWR